MTTVDTLAGRLPTSGVQTDLWGPGQAAQVSLVDILDRLLGTGIVLAGDIVISLAGVDLVEVRLNALLTTVRSDLAHDPAHDGGHR